MAIIRDLYPISIPNNSQTEPIKGFFFIQIEMPIRYPNTAQKGGKKVKSG